MTDELNGDPQAAIAALQAENARLNSELSGMKDENRYVPRDRLNQESAKRKEAEGQVSKYAEDMKRIVGMNMGYEQRIREYEESGETVKELQSKMTEQQATHAAETALLEAGVKDPTARRVIRGLHKEDGSADDFVTWWGANSDKYAMLTQTTLPAPAAPSEPAATTDLAQPMATDAAPAPPTAPPARLPGNEGAKPTPPPAQGVTLEDITDPSRLSKEQFDEWRKSGAGL